MSDNDEYMHDSIAIIGMSGRFPGAPNLEAFWRNLRDGVESITFFSDDELEDSGWDTDLADLPDLIKAAPLLDDIAMFDATFFGYTPREAQFMDPQHRIFLECAWEALENAGYDSEQYKGWIGMYGGSALNGYLLYNLYGRPDIMDPMNVLQVTTANERDYLTTRVSYKLNLKGPSVSMQTACSTSLVAIHMACQGLLNYQCDMALAGGVSIRIPEKGGYWYQEGGITSPDGHCRAFDARAQGTVFGSAVGVVLLKRLADALADGDSIAAIIRGSAINNDGALKAGFTAPSVDGQRAVIAMAQGLAGVDPETITYIEAHGTGTSIGDPIEVAALTQVFRTRTQKKGFCAIGSVKTNIGHASAAAGMAGLSKAILALQHRQIPPSLHYESPNPKINFADSPFYVNTTLAEWAANGVPRRAGVSSFGVGGTNAHLILEEAPPLEQHPTRRPWQLLVLSAKTASALEAATANLADQLERQPDLSLADVAYTLQVGRRSFNHRHALVCRDRADALDALRHDPKRLLTLTRAQREPPVAFMFSGQGSQYAHMAGELYQTEPLFRAQVDQCAELLVPHLRCDLREIIYSMMKDERRTTNAAATPSSFVARPSSDPSALLDQTQYAQPALFVIAYALAQLWLSWGIQPQALIGHSIGEYVAATLAGVFALEDALALVAARGRLMQQLPPGAMLALQLPERDVLPLLDDQLALAAVNGHARCVVAGPFAAIAALEQRLAAQGLDYRRLHTSHAFHSQMMDPIIEPFVAQLQSMPLNAPSIPFISNVSGTWITAAEATDPHYWGRHLRGTVRFADGLRELLRDPACVLLELGPGQTLTALARQHPDKTPAHVVQPALHAPQEQRSDVEILLHALGQLWLSGMTIAWPRLYAHEQRRRVPLPTYPFERQRYWIDPPDKATSARAGSLRRKADIADWFSIPSWKRSIRPARPADTAALCWLLFCDDYGMGARLAQRLTQAGHTVVTATAGAQFGRRAERSYTIAPAERGDYEALFQELHAAGTLPQRIVHLWNVTPPAERWQADQHAQADEDRSFYSILSLVQAIGNLTGPFQLDVVSNNMQHIAGEQQLDPSKALLLGPCKVAPQEYPNITCRSIDLVIASERSHDMPLDQLVAELATPIQESVVAYRDYDRWVPSYEAVRLPPAPDAQFRLRQGGVYLITGGLGGIGLVLAEYLAEVAPKLVLIGRSAFPARAEWQRWLATHAEHDSVSRKIHALRRLEDQGAELLIVSADAADPAQMRDLIAQVRQRFGALHGVVHAAGVAGGGLIPLKTREMAARVLAPKVGALWALDAALANVDLDFMLLCSSTIAVVGGIGQVDYCAANAFLDAYAHHYTARRGVFTVSINWDAWQDVGMAVNTAAEYDQREPPPAPARPIAHPLLDSCHQNAHEQLYSTTLSPATHWVLSEHKILDTPTLPGTAYLEMVRAAFADYAGPGAIMLQDVFFLSPLRVPTDTAKEVRTSLSGAADAAEFHVMSMLAADGVPTWQEHTRGKVARSAGSARQHDIAALIAQCSLRSITVTANDILDLEKFVYWGPRWRTIRTIHVGVNQRIALLELPEEAAADVGQLWLHPALLDVATVFGSWMLGGGHNYLPLSYRKLTLFAPFTPKIYSYVTFDADDAANKETLTFDIIITDEQGRELATIEEFTLRRVSAAMMRQREQSVADHAAEALNLPEAAALTVDQPPRTASAVVGISSRAGIDVFKRILAHGGLAQIVVATRDLQALIEQISAITTARVLERIDESSDREMLPRPDVQTDYVAPRNAIEQRLADVWQGMLGIAQIGIHDNFFELGGDSVLAIQIIAKCVSAGVPITPAQLFQHQTIAALAAATDGAVLAQSEPSPTRTLPLTPLQRWRCEQQPASTGWDEAYLIETCSLDPALLVRALRQVIGDHAALRLRFSQAGLAWQQSDDQVKRPPRYSYIDLAAIDESRHERLIQVVAASSAADLDPATAPATASTRLVQFGAGVGRPSWLLLNIHRLAADSVSWQIVLDDLQTAYQQQAHGTAIQRAAPTSAFQSWAERLTTYARSEALRSELDYWLAPERLRITPLPAEQPAPADAASPPVSALLSAEETDQLLEAAAVAYHTSAEELVLTALALALKPWANTSLLLLDIERRGERQGPFADIDLAHTVGCCAARFPLLLNLGRAADPVSALKAIKEQLHSVPTGGIGYGLLRYLAEDPAIAERLQALPQAEIAFMWQGRPAPPAPTSALGWSSRALHGYARAHCYPLAISARISADQLRLDWHYDPSSYRQATIQQLAQRCIQALQSLITASHIAETGSFTPSDFPEAGLSQAALDKFLSSMNQRK
jgi:non-ribosomal peptide synthase protein (TIGR01720 family)